MTVIYETLPFPVEKIREALESRGFRVTGFVNRRPQFDERVDMEEVDRIVIAVMRGEDPPSPRPKSQHPPHRKPPGPYPRLRKRGGKE